MLTAFYEHSVSIHFVLHVPQSNYTYELMRVLLYTLHCMQVSWHCMQVLQYSMQVSWHCMQVSWQRSRSSCNAASVDQVEAAWLHRPSSHAVSCHEELTSMRYTQSYLGCRVLSGARGEQGSYHCACLLQ